MYENEPSQLYAPIQATKLLTDQPTGGSNTDPAAEQAAKDGGMSLAQLEQIAETIRYEPPWRLEADVCCAYYDNKQLDADTIQKLEEVGLGPLMRNIIKPTVDAVLGLEERTRTDWRVTTDYDDQQEVAEALTVKLTEAERESHADRACSDAYASQIKAGFGCVEVSRATNPFAYQYRVRNIHRREIYWDPLSKELDWSDARFVVRRRWFDVDQVAAHFPRHVKLIEGAAGGWGEGFLESMMVLSQSDEANPLVNALTMAKSLEGQTNLLDIEWRDTTRKRVQVSEVWYRTFTRGIVMKLPRGRIVEYEPTNKIHYALAQARKVQLCEAVYDKLRCAYFVGPHRLEDYATGRRRFPYIPFFGYREDSSGAPYGLIRSMVSVQDEINARLAKFMWLLSSRRTVIDSDAVEEGNEYNSMSDVANEVNKARSFIVLNPNRRNQQAIVVTENLELADAQHKAMQDATQAMPAVSGVFAPLLGQNTTTTAGNAIEALIQQGTTTLAEINGNYSFARRAVGDALLELVKEDLVGVEMQVAIDTGTSKKSVYINKRTMDPTTGLEGMENNIEASQVKVSLSDVPGTPSYRAQQFAQIAEVAKSLPPEAQAIITPFLMEATDLPKRKEIAKLLREKLGIAADPDSPEGKAIAEQNAKQQAKIDALDAATLDEQRAKAEKLRAEAEKIRAEAMHVGNGEAAAEVQKVSEQFQQQIAQLNDALAQAKLDANNKQAEVAMKRDVEMRRVDSEIERERIKAGALAESTRIKAASDEVEKRLQEQVRQLSEELEEQLAAFTEQITGDREAMEAREQKKAEKEAIARERETEREKLDRERQAFEQERAAVGKEDAIARLAKLIEQSTSEQQKAMREVVQRLEKLEARPKERVIKLTDPVTGKEITATVQPKE